MSSWIFQGNPERFDLDGYLALDVASITWVMRQRAGDVSIGDTVYFWRSAGKDREGSGIVAECRVASPVSVRMPDDASLAFWAEESPKPEARVDLVVIRVATSRQVLKRDWLKADPVLRELLLFRQAQGTNYFLEPEHAERLDALWSRTGVDWTWRDSVAGLWAYQQTVGKEVSKLPGSPVAIVALAIGRAVSGVYNKVMNFRSIDPTDPRTGFPGRGETDTAVWGEFFEPSNGAINTERLFSEVARLGLVSRLTGVADSSQREAPQPRASGTLDGLLKRYAAARAAGVFPLIPTKTLASTNAYARNPLVVTIAKRRAACACEMPGCNVPTFVSWDDESFCEVHHIHPLAEGGEDVIENVICLCPLHHREAHHGKRRRELREVMRAVRVPPAKAGAAVS
jgi:hypothetical protein